MGNNTQVSTGSKALIDIIKQVARHGLVDSKTGAVYGTERIVGYVAKIHTSGDLKGTIDVQEFLDSPTDGELIGYHEGVYLSALQDNNGLLVIPKLYSEVVVVSDPATKREYVSMFSHVDVIQLDSHVGVTIGVTEREEFDLDDDDGDDIEDLQPTGLSATTTYTNQSIISKVTGDKDETKMSQQAMSPDDIELKVGSSLVKVEDGTIHLGSTTNTDDAVLGSELASILSDLVGYLSQMMTPTLLGPQPPVNLPQFIALKAKIESFAATHSGFLTSKVKIQK